MERSQLARLPAELRNCIYEQVFSSIFSTPLKHGELQHPITRTCRQLRRECLELYYVSTRFNAYLRDGPIKPLLMWLRTIGPEAFLLIQEIRIWDMHHNVLTLLSPSAGFELVSDTDADSCVRSLSNRAGPPGDNALDPDHQSQLWEMLQQMGLSLRQLCEQRAGADFPSSTSTYVLARAQGLPGPCCNHADRGLSGHPS